MGGQGAGLRCCSQSLRSWANREHLPLKQTGQKQKFLLLAGDYFNVQVIKQNRPGRRFEPSRVDFLIRAFSSVVERFVDIEKVIGSIPITPTGLIIKFDNILLIKVEAREPACRQAGL